jgi:hypothetical protein
MKKIAGDGNVVTMLTEERNRMVDIFAVMKKVTGVLLISFSLLGCSTSYYADTKINTNSDYRNVTSVVGLVYNLGKHSAYSVPKEARVEHEQCVYMMLDNGNPGESCSWRTNNARGTVRVAMIRPNMCHELISTVTYQAKSTSFKDTACLQGNKWKFYEE